MVTKDEALKLALEALGSADWYINQLEMIVYSVDDDGTHENRAKVQATITAIKEALAQPAQEESLEPFEYWNAVEGWVKIEEVRNHFGTVGCGTIYKTAGEDRVPLYTTPPQRPWVGLTDGEREEIENRPFSQNDWLWSYACAIESALKKKNT